MAESFILAGNSSYKNRGCEAIIRGTTAILDNFYAAPRYEAVSFFPTKEAAAEQAAREINPAIHNHAFPQRSRFSPAWFERNFRKYLLPGSEKYIIYRPLSKFLPECKAVLSVGGDNYSLDYGTPNAFVNMDDFILARDKPLVLWGASVGPFSANRDFERFMAAHLKRATAIFARETATLEYLESIGVRNNVYLTADPAFLMAPSIPADGFKPEPENIGINLSPLMAKYVTGGDMGKWLHLCANMVAKTARDTKRKIYLIAHVTTPNTNDYGFLCAVAAQLPKNISVSIVPPVYSAAEIKHIISCLDIFAGARTHSTIAALSSHVPTLSLAYSIKAQGINKDILGHLDFCMAPGDLTADSFSGKITKMLETKNEIRQTLKEKIPKIKATALSAGEKLKEILR
ncbi:MAG: polysaccharide pyruvyl transferase family protein [Elusimicrobiaceae bacterium]